MEQTVIAFDLYGTILSTGSVKEELGRICGEDKATEIASQARRYQLEYTWRSNSMGVYRPFDDITRASFQHAAAEADVTFTSTHLESIMSAYNKLDTFPDADKALKLLSQNNSIDPYIFSNGTPDMLAASVQSSSSASHVLPSHKIISVSNVRKFKPDPATYQHFAKTVAESGVSVSSSQLWLVSSNPFDALGAVMAGWQSAWVDRAGKGWIDGLGAVLDEKPTIVAQGVEEAVSRIMEHEQTRK